MSTTLQIVISVLAGGFITWFFSWFFFRRQNRKFRIAHFMTDAYDIGKGLTDIFPDFELTYKGNSMCHLVYVLKGGFMNIGHSDIEGLKGKEDISMFLPEGCNVRDIKIFTSDEQLIVNEQHKNNLIKFGIEKFLAPDEFFRYVAIVESNQETESWFWGKILKFNHRILKTKKEITNYNIGLGNGDKVDNRRGLLLSLVLTIISFSCIGIISSLDSNGLIYWIILAILFFFLATVIITRFFFDEWHIRKVLRKNMKQKQ